ncbi:MAG: hypothetical protein LBJ38_00485 [Oscillospiraceae bacterium]|jgi:hypothetical protein|nr:hypothetical protein [Oscillospiraceae bacterium]
MSSSEKTANLRLNQWKGPDRPERDDFNKDNLLIDEAVTSIKRQLEAGANGELRAGGIRIGEYVGNGQLKRTIDLGFVPKWTFVFCAGESFLNCCNGGLNMEINAGILVGTLGSVGIQPSPKGFIVINTPGAVPTGRTPQLNADGKKYGYVAI